MRPGWLPTVVQLISFGDARLATHRMHGFLFMFYSLFLARLAWLPTVCCFFYLFILFCFIGFGDDNLATCCTIVYSLLVLVRLA